MTRLLLFSLALLLCPSAFAQNYTVSPEVIDVAVNVDTVENAFEVRAPAVITNNTDETLRISWERIVNDIPDCWLTTVFGVWIVAVPAADSLSFELEPLAEGALEVNAIIGLPDGTARGGEGEVTLRLTNLDDPTDTLIINYHFSVIAETSCVTSTITLEDMPVKIYPNPTSDYFQVEAAVNAQQLTILDLMGKPIRQMQMQPDQQYDVTDLPTGVYILQIRDQSDQLLGTTRLVKT